ncbi:MAG: maltose ABC transporter substrate-binding protein [Lachnospiraceae bacterium]|jgi:arabinogalactan oligomer/maltooligosaccharide transport system substrate-binding protein|nr:maltose ABC transporter substrate-binding protein [Lachnospiraceae bacterium]
MKKTISLLLVILLITSLAACVEYDGRTSGGGGGSGGTIEFYGLEKTTDPVELLVWLDDETWALELIQAFMAHHPNVSFRFQQMGNVASRTHLQLDGPAGLGADVFAFPHDQVPFTIADGLIEPVPPLLQEKWERELVPTAISTITHEGSMYAVPFQVENIALLYNKDLWGPEPPETWEEVFEFAKTYNNPATNDWTFAWEVWNSYHNFIWLSAAGMELFGPNMDDYRKPNFDSPEAAKGLEIFLSMRQLFDIAIDDINFNTSEERFRLGEIPLTLTGVWALPDCIENGLNFGVAKIPTIGGVQPIAYSGNMIAGVSSFSDPVNVPWAYAFIDFMVSEEGAAIMYKMRNTMTTRIDTSQIPGLSDDEYLLGFAQQTPYTVAMPTIPQVSQMWTPMEEMFRFSWDGDMSIPDVQQRAMDTYRLLLSVAEIPVDF